jgi:hypothetical protein
VLLSFPLQINALQWTPFWSVTLKSAFSIAAAEAHWVIAEIYKVLAG